MKIIATLVLILIILGGAGYYYLYQKYPYGSWNYRITVNIETPEGLKSGSAVRKMTRAVPMLNLPQATGHYGVEGEAVVIDLGERGTVFALIDWDSYNEVYKALPQPKNAQMWDIEYYMGLKPGTKGDLPPEEYPKMVSFGDVDDPSTQKLLYFVHANGVTNSYEEVLGDGVQLKSITIEITDDSVTWGIIDKFIPSLEEGRYGAKYLNFKRRI
ncbi:MAG: hypothetical protein GC137_06105 [Alphaproteobacteria bacterium]|nr:hypothetical protein [Alphaproteobacteria bacterium]